MAKMITIEYDSEGNRLEATYQEKCLKCNGTGVFRSWNGFAHGSCFACKGVGHKTYKNSAEDRAKSRAQSAARKQRGEQQNLTFFSEYHPEEYQWICNNAESFAFAGSMLEAIKKWGELTEKQLAAVQKCVVSSRDREAARRAAKEAREAAAPTIQTDALMRAFDTAKKNGLKYPRMRFEGFVVSPAGESSKNAGALYVKNGETYLGKIADGRFFASRDCSTETAAHVAEIMKDPDAAATAYGMKTGSCSICGLELTNAKSIKRGIGPICAGKYGFKAEAA